jgi:hypothetical protein
MQQERGEQNPHLLLVRHSRNLQLRPVLMTDSLLTPNSKGLELLA